MQSLSIRSLCGTLNQMFLARDFDSLNGLTCCGSGLLLLLLLVWLGGSARPKKRVIGLGKREIRRQLREQEAIEAARLANQEAEVRDQWLQAEAILRDIGATEDDVARVKNATEASGVSPLDAVKHVLEFNTRERVRAALPPPNQCFKCGESDWQFESVSPNVKAAKWKCTYCGRIELITSVEAPDPKAQAREAIPRAVQREVWRRDGGKCQRCGSQENLEFDHIIPVIRGGSSTARNLQLLCSICNGVKSDSEPGTH